MHDRDGIGNSEFSFNEFSNKGTMKEMKKIKRGVTNVFKRNPAGLRVEMKFHLFSRPRGPNRIE